MTATEAATKKKPKKLGQPSASEETASPYPKMDLCQDIHRLQNGASDLAESVLQQVLEDLENPSLYRILTKDAMDTVSESDLNQMAERHRTKLKELEAAVETAQENAGDMEVLDARIEVARFAAKSLSEKEALEAYDKLLALPKLSSAKRIDGHMEMARVASFYGNTTKADECIASADKAAGDGGDWDRRNRLKVYKALQQLLQRDSASAATALLDCIATFSCNEICSYTQFIVYTIMTNLLHLPRLQLKTKIIDGPEVMSVAKEIPIVIKLVNAFYDCDYKAFLHSMVEVEEVLLADRYFHPHAAYWMREMHILAYKQFLDSYQSVEIGAMANAFGVSIDFIDLHASRFIAANRLTAKIDKYGGVIVTNRPDKKNAQYRQVIQKGDLLLNRIQKLARVVDL